jgi:hypothetical protein
MRKSAERVLIFVKKQARPFHEPSTASGLQTDLGLDGDDAAEFFDAFFREFDVDASEFNLAEYFGPENAASPLSLARAAFGKKPNYRTLTVTDLIAAVECGQWKRPTNTIGGQ